MSSKRAPLLACMLALGLLAGCADEREAGTSTRSGTVGGPLPTPAGTSGGSVTGMPTSPPSAPPAPADELPAPAVEPAPADGLVAVVPGDAPPVAGDVQPMAATPAPATPAAPAGPTPADLAAAGIVVRDYMAALRAGSPAGAQQLWSTTPNDGAVQQLARGAAFDVQVLAPARPAEATDAQVVTVPVRVRGNAEDGSARAVVALYTVRRTAEGAWRIASANLREDAP